MISKEAIDLIIAEEVSSKEAYERTYKHPEWPGGSSGITIGIGYDLGYCTLSEFRRDWHSLAREDMALLEMMVGRSGSTMESKLSLVKHIVVPWDAAYDVFSNTDMPKWERTVLQHIPEARNLSPDCLGVIVSLAYNRGASFDNSGDRYEEMRNIKRYIQSGEYTKVPSELRSMKRLWAGKGLPGVINRREHEAKLFEKGLRQTSVPSTGTTDWLTQLINAVLSIFKRKET